MSFKALSITSLVRVVFFFFLDIINTHFIPSQSIIPTAQFICLLLCPKRFNIFVCVAVNSLPFSVSVEVKGTDDLPVVRDTICFSAHLNTLHQSWFTAVEKKRKSDSIFSFVSFNYNANRSTKYFGRHHFCLICGYSQREIKK